MYEHTVEIKTKRDACGVRAKYCINKETHTEKLCNFTLLVQKPLILHNYFWIPRNRGYYMDFHYTVSLHNWNMENRLMSHLWVWCEDFVPDNMQEDTVHILLHEFCHKETAWFFPARSVTAEQQLDHLKNRTWVGTFCQENLMNTRYHYGLL